jgi:hypothetical protein
MISFGGADPLAEGEDEDDLPPEVMLWLLERTLDAISETERPKALRGLLEMFAEIYEDTDVPVPDWVVLGLQVTEELSDSE